MTLQEAKSLWVGDIVLLSKSARKGKFLGITAQQKLKVEVNGKIIISSLTNVSVIGTEEVADWRLEIDQELKNPIPTESEKRKKKNIDYSALNSIDLHLEKLLENGTLSTLEHALDVQMKAAKDFIDENINRKRFKTTIIHGKGEGILKNHIVELLRSYREVRFFSEINNGGATEVLFEYL